MDRVLSVMRSYENMRLENDFRNQDFKLLCHGISYALRNWCGDNWVGERKSREAEKKYQDFFLGLNRLLCFFKENRFRRTRRETQLLNHTVFTGDVFRYLGSSDYRNKSIIEPEYNDIYVSWSKEKENSYLESKLYGPITRLYGRITEPHFGIDISGFTSFFYKYYDKDVLIARGTECEIVYPTLEASIYRIEYIDEYIERDDEDESV